MRETRKSGKTDRTARLLNVEHLLYQNPGGISIEEIAHRCGVSPRTSYRDLIALELELGLPIWQEGNRRAIVEGYLLPPIQFSWPEALNLFLAIRLMLKYAHRYDPNMASTFIKLNSIVPSPLQDEITKTLDWMQKLPVNGKYLRILTTLAESWILRRQVKISYLSLGASEITERIIEPYFIEPAALGHASYVVAYCHNAKSRRTFKIERMENAELTPQTYTVPDDFDANAYFSSSWGIVVDSEVKTVRLKLQTDIARIMQESIWHPSQEFEAQEDGSTIMTLRVTDTKELRSWILGWGDKVEVLEPTELRQNIIKTARALLRRYQKER